MFMCACKNHYSVKYFPNTHFDWLYDWSMKYNHNSEIITFFWTGDFSSSILCLIVCLLLLLLLSYAYIWFVESFHSTIEQVENSNRYEYNKSLYHLWNFFQTFVPLSNCCHYSVNWNKTNRNHINVYQCINAPLNMSSQSPLTHVHQFHGVCIYVDALTRWRIDTHWYDL